MNQGNTSSDPSSLHSMVAQVTSKVHQLTENSSQQMTQNAMFNTYLHKLSERLDAAEQRIAHLEAVGKILVEKNKNTYGLHGVVPSSEFWQGCRLCFTAVEVFIIVRL
jgi:hypothetical protein